MPVELRPFVGHVVELGYAGVAAAGEVHAGQNLYLEWNRDRLLSGFLIPEQDVEFLGRGFVAPSPGQALASFPDTGTAPRERREG
jgi:hypothetical protein